MSELKHVAVIFGGVSPEHDISILSGVQAFFALDQSRFIAHPVYIDTTGRWWSGHYLIPNHKDLLKGQFHKHVDRVCLGPGGLFVKDQLMQSIDVCLIALHGGGGENGSVQGMCELFQMPYTGMRRLGASIAMNKWISKHLLKSVGINVLPGHHLERLAPGEFYSVEDLKVLNLTFPVCVKPCSLGSSIGVHFANNVEEVQSIILHLFEQDDAVLIEPAVQSLKEFNVSVMRCSQGVELSAIESPKIDCWLDFEQKYCQGRGAKKSSPEGLINLSRELHPEMPKDMKQKLIADAKKAYETLGGYGVPRIDFLADMKKGEIWLNEVNATPGSFSYYLWAAKHQHNGFVWLINHLVDEGLSIHSQHCIKDPVPKMAMIFDR